MAIKTYSFQVKSQGYTDIIDITKFVSNHIKESKVSEGTAVIFCPGATGAITTIEYEPGLKKDLKEFLEKYFPYNYDYAHHQTWHDNNGSSHLRATLLGPSLSVPFVDSNLILGTWQQIIFIDFDTRPRNRKLICQILY